MFQVFNGDFVDRGDFGTEVLLILYCCKAIFPSNVYLNRGNHEQAHMVNFFKKKIKLFL